MCKSNELLATPSCHWKSKAIVHKSDTEALGQLRRRGWDEVLDGRDNEISSPDTQQRAAMLKRQNLEAESLEGQLKVHSNMVREGCSICVSGAASRRANSS